MLIRKSEVLQIKHIRKKLFLLINSLLNILPWNMDLNIMRHLMAVAEKWSLVPKQ